ncbi:MAG: DUF4407 domain-containing protein [Tannerellaceae bacterium]|jgi:hypothetical protein|nr:DUF4407 domain-containing protein [Tannerellaceae bacterium]
MNWWIKWGCFLTGWNSKILSNCSESSHQQLKKYTAALLILIILWAFTGYCFADRYVAGLPWWGCAISAVLFVLIIIQIERQIILTVGHNIGMTLFRVFIAVLMSLLGSVILDQIIFANDIEKKKIELVEQQVTQQLPQRAALIDAELERLQQEIDSLENVNLKLNEEISKKPTITTTEGANVYEYVPQPDGTTERVLVRREIKTIPKENPLIAVVETNNKFLEQLRAQKDTYTEGKMNLADTLRTELIAKSTGFLEELNAMLYILTERNEALIFYLCIFSFLVSLELFVVTSKWGDKRCDYDLMMEYQLNIKKEALEKLVKKI